MKKITGEQLISEIFDTKSPSIFDLTSSDLKTEITICEEEEKNYHTSSLTKGMYHCIYI